MIIIFRMNNPTEFIPCLIIIIFPMLSPSTLGRLLQTKSAGSGFVVSLQARNQVSKLSTEMELVRWPRGARSMTCEQDWCVCVILHISSWRYGRIVTLFWCINDDYNLCVCVCVILHIASWRYGRIVTLFWCINDDCNLCVILHLKRHAVQFFVWFTYSLAKLKEQANGGWLIRVSFDVICSWFRISYP
jgi:hypothetical protein